MNENSVVAANEEEMTIGRWGIAWQRFMIENHPAEATELQATERWSELALELDREAWELRELLRKQYSKANPRPTTFTEIVKWENTYDFYIGHEIMEQIVLQFRA